MPPPRGRRRRRLRLPAGLPALLPAVRARQATGVLLAAAVLLGAASWVGARWAESGDGSRAAGPPTAAAPTPPDPGAVPGPPVPPAAGPAVPAPVAGADTDWLAVVQELYARRAEAFTRADPAGLDAVYSAGSPLRAADEAAVRALADAGRRLAGFTPRVEGPVVVVATGDRVRLEASDGWGGYAVVSADDPDGPALAHVPGRGTGPVVLELVAAPDGWRIDEAARGE